MNKKNFILIFTFIFCITALMISQTQAHWKNKPSSGDMGYEGGTCVVGQGRQSFGHPQDFQRLCEQLNLTIEQRKKMHSMRFDFLKKSIDVREELGEKKLSRKELLKKNSVDWKKVDQLTDKIAELQAKMEKQRMRQHNKVKKILTEEQLVLFEQKGCGTGRGMGTGQGGRGFGSGRGLGRGPGFN